mgnify:CR=1 FL=1
MNKHQVKGVTNQVTGEVKRQVGKLTGDRSAQAAGGARQVKGKLQKDLGDAKEIVRNDRRELDRTSTTRGRR